ncbi:unnamed protein product, partial [Effrenium voratum]
GFTTAISQADSASYWERALFLFSSAPSAVARDIAFFGAALAACQTGAAWRQSLQILEEMCREDWETPASLVVAYSAAIGTCVHGGRWARALQLLQRCRAQA